MYGFKEIDVQDLKNMLDGDEPLQLIDVRSPAEIARGRIPEARALPLSTLPLHQQDIDREKPVVFYCQSGGRSAQAAAFMANQGLSNVLNLRGGFAAWARTGYPVVVD